MKTPDNQTVLDRAFARHQSLVVATVDSEGEALHLGGRVPPAGDTLFQIGSVTKVFTALLLAAAVRRGEVELDQPVVSLLSADGRWRAEHRDITLKELATHTSGLPRLPPGSLGKSLSRHRDPYADIDAEQLHASLAASRIRKRGRQRYSNLGFGLLGHALASAAGTTYAELVRVEVCAPLGMPDTVLRLDADQQARAAVGHTRRLKPRSVAWQFDALAGAGALWSTAVDLRRFLAAQLDPPEGLLGDAIRLTQQPHFERGKTAHGLAWMGLPPMSRTAGFFHNGGTAGFRSMVTLSPPAGAAVVALTNSDRSVDGVGLTMLQNLTTR